MSVAWVTTSGSNGSDLGGDPPIPARRMLPHVPRLRRTWNIDTKRSTARIWWYPMNTEGCALPRESSADRGIPLGGLTCGFVSRMGRRLVGAAGFEPATSCSQSTRAAKLRHAP
jgi:hypothetical protein